MVLLGMGAALTSVEVSRLLLGCWELFTSQGNIHHHSINHPFSNSTPSCKMSLFLGDSLHTADLVGNFSLIKFGQPRLRELLQGPNVKTQWDIAQPMRTGHFPP